MIYYDISKKDTQYWLSETSYKNDYSLKTESVFAQCNGYLGVRAAHDFKTLKENRGMFISGVYEKANNEEVTELVNCPDLTELTCILDGEAISLDTCVLKKYRRSFNTHTGELVSKYCCELRNGIEIMVESGRFASRADKHLFCQRIAITPINRSVEKAIFISGINGQKTNSGVSEFIKADCRVYDQKYMNVSCFLNQNAVEITSLNQMEAVKKPESESFHLERRSIYGSMDFAISKGETVTFFKYNYIESGTDSALEHRKETITILNSCAQSGYDELLRKHIERMNLFWQFAKIEIEGASTEEMGSISFAQYHLMGMTPEDTSEFSIPAKGLTGEGYKGHIFWDTEIFILPFFIYTFPDIARRLLEFRYKGIEGALKKAIDLGYEGMMFPWEAAYNGSEETPLYAALNIYTGKANKVWSAVKEHHISADIVYAVWNYYSITKDTAFMNYYGYEIIFGVAVFWASRVHYAAEKDQYHILDIIGPDEYTEHIDNNAYSNYMAKFCLELACLLEKECRQNQIKYKELNLKMDLQKQVIKWERIIEKIYVPLANEDSLIPQDDTFLQKKQLDHIEKYRNSDIKQAILKDYSRDEIVDMQILKQADVVMLLNMFPDLFPKEIVKKNVLYYESRTVHDSSLSYCAHAQACAGIGENEAAWKFFQKALEIDIDTNPKDSTDGIHAASMGGIWNCVINGFAGISHDEKSISIDPKLPAHWKKMKFHIQVQGVYILVEIQKDFISLVSEKTFAEPLKVRIKEKEMLFADILKIS